MNKRIKIFGIAFCLTTVLAVLLSSCDKDNVLYNKIEGIWTLTSDPSCTWTFLKEELDIDGTCFYDRNAVISVDTFKTLTCKYQIENNTLSFYGDNYMEVGTHVGDSYLSIDCVDKDKLHISGNIRIYEITENHDRIDHNTTISYEFRKSN